MDLLDPKKGDAIARAVRARVEAEQSLLDHREPEPPKLHYIEQCAAFGENGLSLLLVELMRDKVFNDASGKVFYIWTGHYWQLDRVGQAFRLCLQALIQTLERGQNELEQQKKACLERKDSAGAEHLEKRAGVLEKAIDRLQGLHFADKVLTLACRGENSLAVDGNRLDCKPWLWPCVNATVDLRTGETRRSYPGDLLTRICPTSWKGIDEPAPRWEQFLKEISNDREDWVLYLQKVIGLAMIGESIERIFPILRGDTSNGKSTFAETIMKICGPLAGVIESEMFLANSQKKAGGVSTEIVELRGLRIGFASEVDGNAKFSTAKVKNYCGEDSLKGRNPHALSITFTPSHTLFLMCNHLPRMTDDDPAFWRRARVIPFDVDFCDHPEKLNERPVDKKLKKKLLEEASGILAWCIKGALLYLEHGLADVPACVLEATGDYKEGEDIFSPFIKQALVTAPGNELKVSEIYNKSFRYWAAQNGYGPRSTPSMKRFSESLRRRLQGKWYKDGHDVIRFTDIDIVPEYFHEQE